MIDESSEFGARVARHLREETIVWLTTVTPSGAPLLRPVGFLWDGGENVFVYSQPGARIRNISRNPKVTSNFRGDAKRESRPTRARSASGCRCASVSPPSMGSEHCAGGVCAPPGPAAKASSHRRPGPSVGCRGREHI